MSSEYRPDLTAFTIREKSRSIPVAVMRKNSYYKSRHPFEVYTGPRLDELVGYVQPTGAWSAARVQLGELEYREAFFIRNDKRFLTQPGLGTLRGRPVGLSRLTEQPMVRSLSGSAGLAGLLFGTHIRFQSRQSAGFELKYSARPKERFSVRIHDQRVNRLLVFSCVADLLGLSIAPHRLVVDAANLFRRA
ncbi:hypothetical protein LN042_36075 [Kitasatospora sp. RB6PN24]|uniref:hypothetical protein n=1 Tax=Kitasatospora humi TaxID=2893891 RepID=UPI001E618BDE|nr:hypothetical protein [Kitasatospora humi]MCC9312410.1 hypothetical protein [Kitasatospora humi]